MSKMVAPAVQREFSSRCLLQCCVAGCECSVSVLSFSLFGSATLLLLRFYSPESFGVRSMNLELIGQLVSVALIVGAGPIIVAALYVRGGNL